MTGMSSYDSKLTSIFLLHMVEIAEAVLPNVFKMAIRASLFTPNLNQIPNSSNYAITNTQPPSLYQPPIINLLLYRLANETICEDVQVNRCSPTTKEVIMPACQDGATQNETLFSFTWHSLTSWTHISVTSLIIVSKPYRHPILLHLQDNLSPYTPWLFPSWPPWLPWLLPPASCLLPVRSVSPSPRLLARWRMLKGTL